MTARRHLMLYPAVMSPAATRIAAVVIAFVAFLLHLLVTFWIQPLTWHIRPPGAGLLVGFGALLVSGAIPVLSYLVLAPPQRTRPASLRVDARHRRFVAPTSARFPGFSAIVMTWLGAGLIVTERVPNGDRVRVAEIPFALPVSVTSVTLAVAIAATVLFINRPSVSLDATGLTINSFVRRTAIAWSDLAPGGPPPPAVPNPTSIRLYLNGPAANGPLLAKYLPAGRLYVDPAFLSATIRGYVQRPEHRPAIGTEPELTRLQSD